MTEPDSDFAEVRKEIIFAIKLGLDVESGDPAMKEFLPSLTEEQIGWLASWLASENFRRVPSYSSSQLQDVEDKDSPTTDDLLRPCPVCGGSLYWQGTRLGNPPMVVERIYCPACGWVKGVDDAEDRKS